MNIENMPGKPSPPWGSGLGEGEKWRVFASRTLTPTLSLKGRGGCQKASEAPLAAALRSLLRGEVRFDSLSRTIYATDASIYEILPAGVVLPKDVEDVVAAVQECRRHGTSIVPRGAGTGLTGGAVGPGVQLDLSRYLTRIGRFDEEARTIEVEAGVVLDDLNAHVVGHGLQFGPDVATSSRATLGGMIANNSCGAHSIIHGRTVDHLQELAVVLSDGELVTFRRAAEATNWQDPSALSHVARLEAGLAAIRDKYHDEIQRRFPKIPRSNGGYGLDRLGAPGQGAEALKIVCGSEGTLGIVVAARLKLVPLPRHSGLAVLHFHDVLDALAVTPSILRHGPAAVELVDRLIIEAGRSNASLRRRCDYLQGTPQALLIVEFHGADSGEVAARVDSLIADSESSANAYTASRVVEPQSQHDVWALRKAGLGLLMSRPGDAQPHAFVEDSAVDPGGLRDYIREFQEVLQREGVEASFYAHAGAGCIHVRPILSLKRSDDVQRMRRIADSVSSLALAYGGAMTGEHGDGIVRSCWLEKMYGPRIVSAFREVKDLFDPIGLLNPHKIVDPWPMTEHLRSVPGPLAQSIKTHLDFSVYNGPGGLAEMCSGVGQCRQRLVGVMCPSYMATLDEKHTTRARANALRVALSHRGPLAGLDDPQLDEVMDLCLGCKACKTECPTGVDMARLKAEFLSHRIRTDGSTARARWIAALPEQLASASHFPRIANRIAQSKLWQMLLQRRYGMDRRVLPPRLAATTFRNWFRRESKERQGPLAGDAPHGPVVYFVDTWTNYLTPQVGMAAAQLLQQAGFDVHCPAVVCCGWPAISQGLLTEAKRLAELNVRQLVRFASQGTPIVGTEPSCILTLLDEYPQLVPSAAARTVAERTMTLDSFLARLLEDDPEALRFVAAREHVLYHAHCHQKALVGSQDAMALLHHAFGDAASEINSGCCGMAGAFGREVEHYDVARAIGEDRLFPAVRARGDAKIVVSGFSCREQIAHHTDVQARHVAEYLADALG